MPARLAQRTRIDRKLRRIQRFASLARLLLMKGMNDEPKKGPGKMSNASTNLLLRNDTILGVCEAIGQDFGFHANWLRLALASSFYFAPLVVTGLYLGLGVVVLLTRWIAPDQQQHVAAPVTAEPASEPLALAA